jgi:cellulose synthase/poly-beta-1,6-N-acetylglucosamine synthase-like glycosyltransferase
MATFISFLLVALASFLAIPIVVFIVEVVAAIALPPRDDSLPLSKDSRGRIAVLVPAHNEGAGLLPTLADIRAQLRVADRILVVADNCTDDTSAVALAAGADVVDRNDPDRRGKGYALAWGISCLGADPPDIVIIIDADCRLAETAIDKLAVACAAARGPVQALYLMIASDDSPINSRVSEFAWRVKNWVRPMGLRALGLPCQLMGTGMAIPWNLIRSVELASGAIVEDLKLGLDLAAAGNPPRFCPAALVTSEFPSSVKGTQSQRQRWEHGHIGMIFSAAPRLIFVAIGKKNLNLLTLALDLAVPPLSSLWLLTAGMFVVGSLATRLGLSSAGMFISAVNLLAFSIGVFLAWLKCGRSILPPNAVLLIVPYVIRKLPFYCRVVCRKSSSEWTRTERRKV